MILHKVALVTGGPAGIGRATAMARSARQRAIAFGAAGALIGVLRQT